MAAPQIIAQLYVVGFGAAGPFAVVIAVLGYAATIVAPTGLGILAIVLGAQRREPAAVRVFPSLRYAARC